MSIEPHNPYASPVTDPTLSVVESTDLVLASLSSRFSGAFMDGLINLLLILPIWGLLFLTGTVKSFAEISRLGLPYTLGIAAIVFGLFVLVQFRFLKATGQTLGKKLAKTRIVTMAGEKPELSKLLINRYGFMNLVGLIPLVGSWIALVDILFIFRKDRRCIHDLIAGTRVVNVIPVVQTVTPAAPFTPPAPNA